MHFNSRVQDVFILEEERKKYCQSEEVIVFSLCSKRGLAWFGK